MEDIRKKQWLLGALVSSMFIEFFFGWLSIDQSISAQITIQWIAPIVWFSLGVSTLCLITFSSRKKMIINVAVALAFAPSLFFVQDVGFIALSCLGVALSIAGLSYMRQDMELYRYIRVYRSMQHGTGWIVFSFALVIASFYYMQIRHASGDALLQKLSLDHTSHVMLTQSLGLLNPEFKKVNQENVTVDEFLLAFQKNQLGGNVDIEVPSDDELLQMTGIKPSDPKATQTLIQIKKGLSENTVTLNPEKLILEQSRKRLSDISGTPISGQEHIADVLSQIIDQRVRTYFQPNMVHGNTSVLPSVLSLILFLTLWSLGSFLNVLWRIVTSLVFALLRRLNIIEVKKVMVEQEVIE